MKILCLSDSVDERIYSPVLREIHADVDMVLGCGDLPNYYLEFAADTLGKRVLFVHGNHHTKPELGIDGELRSLPRGCDLIDGKLINSGGLLFLGLGGSVRYRPNAAQQFTETQMRFRIARLLPALLWSRLRSGRYVDVLVAHSPPRKVGDLEDPAHIGFEAFLTFMSWFRPRYLVHGHVSAWQAGGKRETRFLDTTVVNVNPVYVLDIPSNASFK